MLVFQEPMSPFHPYNRQNPDYRCVLCWFVGAFVIYVIGLIADVYLYTYGHIYLFIGLTVFLAIYALALAFSCFAYAFFIWKIEGL